MLVITIGPSPAGGWHVRPDSSPRSSRSEPEQERSGLQAGQPLATGFRWARGEFGLVVMVLVAIGVLVHQYRETVARGEAGFVLSPPSGSGELQGFRADAWYLPNDALLGFVEIPAGSFLMGSDPAVDPGAYENERWSLGELQGRVELSRYYIGRFPVTVAQFRAFVGATGHPASLEAVSGPLDHPVADVSWPDALAYARWLDAELRTSLNTPPELLRLLEGGARVTLPSEAEWEKAARGGDGRVFPWGDEPRRDRANFQGSGTSPVGSFSCPECPYSVRDMSGNVWERTRSPFQPYPWDPADTPHDLGADALWVMRGGSFSDASRNIRSAVRGGGDPGARRSFLGFRVVISSL